MNTIKLLIYIGYFLILKKNLKRSDKYGASSNLSLYFMRKNIQKSCKNDEFKISAPKCNDDLELPDESYSVADIQNLFEYIN